MLWLLCSAWRSFAFFFFFNDTATTEIYTLSLHDALPICSSPRGHWASRANRTRAARPGPRSEEHTSELQSLRHLVCRLLLEKKKTFRTTIRAVSLVTAGRTYRSASMFATRFTSVSTALSSSGCVIMIFFF